MATTDGDLSYAKNPTGQCKMNHLLPPNLAVRNVMLFIAFPLDSREHESYTERCDFP